MAKFYNYTNVPMEADNMLLPFVVRYIGKNFYAISSDSQEAYRFETQLAAERACNLFNKYAKDYSCITPSLSNRSLITDSSFFTTGSSYLRISTTAEPIKGFIQWAILGPLVINNKYVDKYEWTFQSLRKKTSAFWDQMIYGTNGRTVEKK